MNDRGHYGRKGSNGVPHVGQVPIYVEHKAPSTGALIVGVAAAAGALLWARHQSRQIEQLYKTSGMPYQSFTGGLRERVRSLPDRARAALRSAPSHDQPPAATTEKTSHSRRARSGAR